MIWTRDSAFPITKLGGSVEVPDVRVRTASVIFDVPNEPGAMRIVGMPSG